MKKLIAFSLAAASSLVISTNAMALAPAQGVATVNGIPVATVSAIPLGFATFMGSPACKYMTNWRSVLNPNTATVCTVVELSTISNPSCTANSLQNITSFVTNDGNPCSAIDPTGAASLVLPNGLLLSTIAGDGAFGTLQLAQFGGIALSVRLGV